MFCVFTGMSAALPAGSAALPTGCHNGPDRSDRPHGSDRPAGLSRLPWPDRPHGPHRCGGCHRCHRARRPAGASGCCRSGRSCRCDGSYRPSGPAGCNGRNWFGRRHRRYGTRRAKWRPDRPYRRHGSYCSVNICTTKENAVTMRLSAILKTIKQPL